MNAKPWGPKEEKVVRSFTGDIRVYKKIIINTLLMHTPYDYAEMENLIWEINQINDAYSRGMYMTIGNECIKIARSKNISLSDALIIYKKDHKL